MELRLLCILAHPDDETLGLGGVLASAAAQGATTFLVTATSGEQGWPGAPEGHPGEAQLAVLREVELSKAAAILGIHDVTLLRFPDGKLARVPANEVIGRLAGVIRRVRPHVVVTFGPDGTTGHPDHIAIGQLTSAALICAADPGYQATSGERAHRVAKLYYLATTRAVLDRYDKLFGDSAMTVDGVRRKVPGWPEWAVTTRVDATPFIQTVRDAIGCYRTQLPMLEALAELPNALFAGMIGTTSLYRVYSLVDSPQELELDIFEGLHTEMTTTLARSV